MFNEYLEMSEENADIIMANSVIENLKFIVISLDTVFKSEICADCDIVFLIVSVSGSCCAFVIIGDSEDFSA